MAQLRLQHMCLTCIHRHPRLIEYTAQQSQWPWDEGCWVWCQRLPLIARAHLFELADHKACDTAHRKCARRIRYHGRARVQLIGKRTKRAACRDIQVRAVGPPYRTQAACSDPIPPNALAQGRPCLSPMQTEAQPSCISKVCCPLHAARSEGGAKRPGHTHPSHEPW